MKEQNENEKLKDCPQKAQLGKDGSLSIELTILMPCLNEEKTIAECISAARTYIDRAKINAEILVSDNGSSDGSREIAIQNGAKVVNCEEKGYGAALLTGIQAAQGEFIIFGDADCSYDFKNLDAFVEELRLGADLVMGNRFKGGIAKGAMPFLHQYLGNPVLSWIGKNLFAPQISDFHCGLRGFKKDQINRLGLRCTGMEFASEMVAKGGLANFTMVEVPTTLDKDKRGRPAHLKTWRDGWRHLKFLFMFAPKAVLFWPGLILLLTGLIALLLLFPGELEVAKGLNFHTSSFLMSCLFIIVGGQLLAFYSMLQNIREKMFSGFWIAKRNIFASASFEIALLAAIAALLTGIGMISWSIYIWADSGFGSLDIHSISRFTLSGATLVALGVQLFGAIIANAAVNYSNQEKSDGH